MGDYVSYYNLLTELAPQVRRMIERVKLVKNVLDENTFEESGSIDLQVAIQAIASETPRHDIFVRGEKVLKNESWTILVDSSLSLSGSSKQVKAVSICLAETAREIMASNPWGMFAFSDDLYCIKDFNEPYDNGIKARIGGMAQGGLSHIPDAIRACRRLIAEYARERNYLILVSDGIPSGYPRIEAEFAASVKELAKYGIDLAAIGVAGGGIKKAIHRAKIISRPADIVKEFMEIYSSLSS
jgi:nitric oxide reductase NorD protein